MAKTRMVNTRFWNDGYISELEPIEKLLFIYFLTNSTTNICGIYELPIKVIASETGIEQEKVRNMLARFALDEKIRYEDGWVIIKNFIKHQQSANPKIARGIELELKLVPERLIAYAYPIDSQSHSNPNPNPNFNPNFDSKEETATPPLPVFERKIREKEEEYRDLVKDLAAKDYLPATKIHEIVLNEFLPHWLERSEGAKKARFEKEKAFDYQRRVRTWVTNYHKYKKDWLCSKDKWHGDGEKCYHKEPEVDYKSLPVSGYAKELASKMPKIPEV